MALGRPKSQLTLSSQTYTPDAMRDPSLRYRQPTVFGPAPGPRQDAHGHAFTSTLKQSTISKTTIKFKTSASVLRNLFPNSNYSFDNHSEIAQASFSIESLRNLAWLGWQGYDLLALYLHDVIYTDSHGRQRRGTYVPVMIENLADPIITGREELGVPKLFSDIDISRTDTSVKVSVSWRGAQWATLEVEGLKAEQPATPAERDSNGSESEGLLVHKYIPSTGGDGAQPDADYDVLILNVPNASAVKSISVAEPAGVSVQIHNLGSQKLPTLHTVVDGLARIPVLEIVEASVTELQGVSDLSNVERLS